MSMPLRRSLVVSTMLLASILVARLPRTVAFAQEPEPPEQTSVAEEGPGDDPAVATSNDAATADSPFYARYPTAAAYLKSIGAAPSDDPGEDGADSTSLQALRLLFQLERLADDRLAAWTRIEDRQLPEDPADLPSLAAVRWSGVVEQVDVVEVPEDLYLDMAEAYVLHVRLQGEESANWRIVVARAPQSWLQEAPNVEASGNAIFLKTLSGGDGPLAWAVGDPPVWRPDEADEALGVTPALVSLARSGMNLLELEGLKARNKEEFAVADREPFYAMLRATEVVPPAERREFARDVTLVDLLTKADEYVGEAVRFPARVRRITEIRIEDSRAARLLGRETYWQLDCVYDLEGQPIRMRGREGEDIVFQSTFPATVCTLDLPGELIEERDRSLDRGGQGEVNRQVAVEGYFFRLWAFPTEQTREAGGGALQFGPLTIGTIETVQPPAYDGAWLYWLLLPGALVAGGLVVYLWRAARGDSLNERVRRARLEQDAGDIQRLKDLPTRGAPDFSNLPRRPKNENGEE